LFIFYFYFSQEIREFTGGFQNHREPSQTKLTLQEYEQNTKDESSERWKLCTFGPQTKDIENREPTKNSKIKQNKEQNRSKASK
jgi:hypothetical protein